MKKSQMLKKIHKILVEHDLVQDRATKKNGQICKDILQACEDAGMLPPVMEMEMGGQKITDVGWESEDAK